MSAGLSLQILSPLPRQTLPRASGTVLVRIQAALDCGCPVGAGGRWDYRRFLVKGRLYRNDEEVESKVLSPSQFPGTFEGSFAASTPGTYLLEFEALDPESGMAGRLRSTFSVS